MTLGSNRILHLALVLALASGLLAACGDMTASNGPGAVTIGMSSASSLATSAHPDLPDGTEDWCLFITVERVELMPAGEDDGPVTGAPVDAKPYDLTQLTPGLSVPIASIDVSAFEPGSYDQVRFFIEDGTAWIGFGEDCDEGGTREAVFVPSGLQTGLKVNVDPPLELVEGPAFAPGTADHVELVFDTHRLVQRGGDGSYLLTPTAVRAYAGEAE